MTSLNRYNSEQHRSDISTLNAPSKEPFSEGRTHETYLNCIPQILGCSSLLVNAPPDPPPSGILRLSVCPLAVVLCTIGRSGFEDEAVADMLRW